MMTVCVYLRVMEKDKKGFLKWALIILEGLFGVLLVWLLCTIASALLTMLTMKICMGDCRYEYLDQYYGYIRVGYAAILGICETLFLQRLNRKHNIIGNGRY